MSDLLPDEVQLVLAINLGLIILLLWFVILLLMIREFRKFAHKFVDKGQIDDKTLVVCQESVDNALNFTVTNAETIEQLMVIHRALEAQLQKLEQSSQLNASNEDQVAITQLNSQIESSERLIRQLKSDLDRSVKGLQVARDKLYSQYETVDSLKSERHKLQQEYSQLEQEYLRMSRAAEAQRINAGYTNGNERNTVAQEALDEQKRQVQAMRQELVNVQKKLQHAEKEKNFIEKRYMDMVDELENKKS